MDYIGATRLSLYDRVQSQLFLSIFFSTLFASLEHREHGIRIMHEFLLGQNNITRNLTQPKSNE